MIDDYMNSLEQEVQSNIDSVVSARAQDDNIFGTVLPTAVVNDNNTVDSKKADNIKLRLLLKLNNIEIFGINGEDFNVRY